MSVDAITKANSLSRPSVASSRETCRSRMAKSGSVARNGNVLCSNTLFGINKFAYADCLSSTLNLLLGKFPLGEFSILYDLILLYTKGRCQQSMPGEFPSDKRLS